MRPVTTWARTILPNGTTPLRPAESARGLAAGARENVSIRMWTERLRRSGLVDRDYLTAQTGVRFRSDREASAFVIRSRAALAYSIHPLVEPTWIAAQGDGATPWYVLLLRPGSITTSPVFRDAPLPSRAGESPAATLRRSLATAADDSSALLATIGAAGLPERLSAIANAYREQDARTHFAPLETWDDEREQRFLSSLGPLLAGRAGTAPDAQPRISIVMPVFNRQESVVGAIRSVLDQSFTDWELVIVDDGSTDGTVDAVLETVREDPRVRLLQQANAGVSAARNAALAACRGEFVAFLDSDNAWRPHFLAVMLTALERSRRRIGYAGVELHLDDGEIQYVGRDATRVDLLEGRNAVDMNVLVVARDLIERAGGFDESLRRWVDYDLVLRLLLEDDALFVPVLGVAYDHTDSGAPRITTTAKRSWRNVVLTNALVDWESLENGLPSRIPGRASVLIRTRMQWQQTLATIDAVLATTEGHDVEVVVVDNASPRDEQGILTAAYAGDARVTVLRTAMDLKRPGSLALAFARSTGSTVVVLQAGAEPEPGWLDPLLDAGSDDEPVIAQPLILDESGVVVSSGYSWAGPRMVPFRPLAGHAPEDLGDEAPTDRVAPDAAAFAIPATVWTRLRGLSPRLLEEFDDIDLGLRARELGARTALVPASRVRVARGPITPTSDDLQVFDELWGHRAERVDDAAIAAAGFAIERWDASDQYPAAEIMGQRGFWEQGRRAAPVLRRDGSARQERWAIRIASPAARRGDTWGDTFFARDLAHALRESGRHVIIDRLEAHERPSRDFDDVVVVIRGLAAVPPQPGTVNILWVISHPEKVSDDELRAYDLVFAASAPWARKAAARTGVDVRPLLQATNPDRFRLSAATTGDHLLFVGTPRKAMRPIVQFAIEAGHPPVIFGSGWEGYVDSALVRASSLAADAVGAEYARARAVLNDHWPEMAAEGFLSNRLFDAAATGAAIISDRAAGLDEVFGATVRTADSADDLAALLDDPAGLPSTDERMELAARIRREHSFQARAEAMIDAVARFGGHSLWR